MYTPSDELLQCWKDAFVELVRNTFEDVTDAEVDAMWTRFREEDMQVILDAHPPEPGASDPAVREWLQRTVHWVQYQALEMAVSEPGSVWGSFHEPGPDGKLVRRWFKKAPP